MRIRYVLDEVQVARVQFIYGFELFIDGYRLPKNSLFIEKIWPHFEVHYHEFE
jgi:hypothetical protein